MGRTATLVVLDPAGARIGTLAPIDLPEAAWQEVAGLVEAVRVAHGLRLQILRLLSADRPAPPGGHVTYLAQLDGEPGPAARRAAGLAPATTAGPLRPDSVGTHSSRGPASSSDRALAGPAGPRADRVRQPDADRRRNADRRPDAVRRARGDRRPDGEGRRAPHAEPGGPAASVRWAIEVLRALDPRPVTVAQQRTWNLSAIWRVDAAGWPVAWLKQVPSFSGHEPRVLARIAAVTPDLVPPLLAAGATGRMLLGHLPGRDGTGAPADVCAAVVEALHPVQAHFAARRDDLIGAGVPDGRLTPADFAAAAEPYLPGIAGLAELIAGLPRRLADVAACGLPATLIHGDLHPGNVRVDGDRVRILDWADAVVGDPAYDVVRLTGKLPAPDAAAVTGVWAGRWRAEVPGSDPERAVRLLRPVELLRRAVANTAFLAAIERAEQVYHRSYVAVALAAAVAVAER